MNLIINELSLSGFIDVDDFIKKTLKYTKPILETITKLKVHGLYDIVISKNSRLYSTIVYGNVPFRMVLNQKESPKGLERDLFNKIKKLLLDLQNNPPFWDTNPQHKCTDTYSTTYTTKTCNYSIAEAFERDKKVVSFYNPIFSSIDVIPVLKNETEQINICNILDTNVFWDCILGKETHQINNYPLNWTTILNRNPNNDLFPLSHNLNKIIDLDKYFELRIPLSPENRIPIDKRYSKIVATINYWNYDNDVSSKNSGRTIYFAGSGKQKLYISIDTQHGRFEVFDKNGLHKGEYDYYGNLKKKAKENRTINL